MKPRDLFSVHCSTCDAGTLVEKTRDNTMIVNSEADTLIESNLGTMIINDTDDDDNDNAAGADDSSETMKRQFSFVICSFVLLFTLFASTFLFLTSAMLMSVMGSD